MTDKTIRQRRKEIRDGKFRIAFHSSERVNFFHNLPCEVTGKRLIDIHNAHTKGGGVGRRGPYTSIVPLHWWVHTDFDEMPNAKFEKKYKRTKQSVRDRAPHYQQMWLEHVGKAA